VILQNIRLFRGSWPTECAVVRGRGASDQRCDLLSFRGWLSLSSKLSVHRSNSLSDKLFDRLNIGCSTA